MPCFDKKLEASREDFLLPGTHVILSSAHVSESCSTVFAVS